MRRLLGVMAAAALVVALNFAIARASGLGAGTERFDLVAQLMLQLFGETSDSNASFAAAHGDRTSESPLRELALQVRPGAAYAPGVVAAFSEDRLALGDLTPHELFDVATTSQFEVAPSVVHFTAPSLSSDATVAVVQPSAHFTAAYQPEPPLPDISPAPGTSAFAAPGVRGSGFLTSPAQIGTVKFESKAEGMSSQNPQLALHDTTYGAGADFDVRAGKQSLKVNLSTEYERLTRNDATTFSVSPLASASSWQLPDSGGAPLAVSNYADLNRLSLGAGVSVPVLRGLTLNLNYDAQRLYGGYGLPGLVNLDTMNNSYGGNLTFNIPRMSSSLSIGAYQDRLQDNLLLNGSTQTHEDVNFTVKF